MDKNLLKLKLFFTFGKLNQQIRKYLSKRVKTYNNK